MHKLVLSTQAPGTDFKPPLLPTYNYCGAMNIGQPPSFGMTLGVAYVVPKLGCLSTEVTFCHNLVLTKDIFAVRIPQQ